MNIKRFVGRTTRDALALLREALGVDAVVLSTKPCADGVEVLAMAPDTMQQIERMSAQPVVQAKPAAKAAAAATEVKDDVEQLSMSTLSFQDYVRNRMLKRREAAMQAEAAQAKSAEPAVEPEMSPLQARLAARMSAPAPITPPILREEIRAGADIPMPSLADGRHSMVAFVLALAMAAPTPLRLADLLHEAREKNPDLKAAEAHARAAKAAVSPAGALDDPMLMVQLWNAPLDFSAIPVMVQVSQQLPLGGKRAARRDAAAADAAISEADLAARQRDVETQTALAAKAGAEAARLKQVADDSSAELLRSLQQERDRGARLERELVSERKSKAAPAVSAVVTIGQVTQDKQVGPDAPKPVAADQATVAKARGDAQSNPEDAAEVARLVARASVLLGQGDIGSARIVLERAAETGSAQASFTLAETYDPLILPKWGTYGTRGDAMKARDLYAKAQAGGIKEARERLDALRR